MLKKQKEFPRAAGILMPISSLCSEYGIGTLGEEARGFARFLKAAGQRYWQVLPVCPTSYGDSPYQSFSAFAGNPYFIDLDTMASEGLLDKEELGGYDWGDAPGEVDYGKLYNARFKVLRQAFKIAKKTQKARLDKFRSEYADRLTNYCLFMALKDRFAGASWLEWEDDIRLRKPRAVAKYEHELSEEIDFWWFVQYKFFEQWKSFKSYVNSLGIEIIGDIPIYTAMDSADTWAESELFSFDEGKHPVEVAGVPPDYFSSEGQLWGNPIYRWDVLEENGFEWWKKRMRASTELYDIIRIDHFIGIVRYYAIPAGSETARNGEYREGPGIKLIEAISSAVGSAKIIAEDLGVSLKSVERLLKRTGFPGMKVLQFAFDGDAQNHFLPHSFDRNCVVYGGTHDNDTIVGYFDKLERKEIKHALAYLNVKRRKDIKNALIRAAYASVANTVIFQMQDHLGLGAEARMNFPSTVSGNWRWRMKPGQLSQELADELKSLCEIYGR